MNESNTIPAGGGAAEKFKHTGLLKALKKTPVYKDCRRLYWCVQKGGIGGLKYLLPGRVWVDKVDVCITTKCNMRCDGCDHLIPYYEHPAHLDKERAIASIRKLDEAADRIFHLNILGGEPFLDPDLKYILEAVPTEKCDLVQIVTNATIIPKDPELLDVMRRKKVCVLMSEYSQTEEIRSAFIEMLTREGIAYHVYYPEWTDFGAPQDYHHSPRALKRQYHACKESCHNLRDGKLHACFRSSHGSALGLVPCEEGEYVDILGNTREQNRKQLRRLIWRHKPLLACRYCLRGTEENVGIVRGKQLKK